MAELQDLMRRGLQEHQAGRLREAKKVYQQVLNAEPDRADANHLLGVLAHQMGDAEIAVRLITRAIESDPGVAGYHGNLGYALHALGRLDEAMTHYQEALAIDPDFAEAHMNLGNALVRQNQLDDAIASYRKALAINPDYAAAHNNLGTALQNLGRFDEAIPHFESNGDDNAKARVLECLYGAGRTTEYNEILSEFCRNDPANRRIAALSAFAAQQWNVEDPYPFCKAPLDFVHATNLKSDLSPFDGFSARIIEEIENAPTAWDPLDNAARGGFHTQGNLFDMETPGISMLRTIIGERIEDYRSRYADRVDGLIRQWPRRSKLYGWHVKLLKNGHMDTHYHPSGWLSGGFYLKMPDNLEGDEGTITFSLHGHDYPIRNNDIPSFQHCPKEGDLVLFPSSLFHYTTPFRSDEERHCVAFDVVP
ncbi:MAG: tetratricopeptide repeat protein [Alphaproteobacteria bacterium]|nr:tetratricopeptide repeat protein [Alphaproteobacteria bacterium]